MPKFTTPPQWYDKDGNLTDAKAIKINETNECVNVGSENQPGEKSVTIGVGAVSQLNGISVGYNSQAKANGIAIGFNSQDGNGFGINYGNIAIGSSASISSGCSYGIAIGMESSITNEEPLITMTDSICIGNDSQARASDCIAIGSGAQVNRRHTVQLLGNSILDGRIYIGNKEITVRDEISFADKNNVKRMKVGGQIIPNIYDIRLWFDFTSPEDTTWDSFKTAFLNFYGSIN